MCSLMKVVLKVFKVKKMLSDRLSNMGELCV